MFATGGINEKGPPLLPPTATTSPSVTQPQMDSKWVSEEKWREALSMQRGWLRSLEASPYATTREIEKARGRIGRVWAAGLPEWQARDNPSRLP
jgi:hypothetical protein